MTGKDREQPDGWVRTPLPLMPREDTPEHSWFGRTGEPAPMREAPPEPEPPVTSPIAVAVLSLGLLFAIAVAVGAIYLWTL